MPWHYATEYLNIVYRTDPAAVAAFLPEPLDPGPEPDIAYVAFSKWWALWENQRDMAFTNPERAQYRECAIWVGCSFQGTPGQICLQIWVSNDFTMARGWFMGFAKKLGQTHLTEYHPLNPAMHPRTHASPPLLDDMSTANTQGYPLRPFTNVTCHNRTPPHLPKVTEKDTERQIMSREWACCTVTCCFYWWAV